MANVINPDGSMMNWEDGPSRTLHRRLRPAYERLLRGLHHLPIFCPDRLSKYTSFWESYIPSRGLCIWEFNIPRALLVNHWNASGTFNSSPIRVFKLVHNTLTPVPVFPIPRDAAIARVLIRGVVKNGVIQRQKIGRPNADLMFTLQYRWSDRVEFFDTTTAHLRAIQLPVERTPHKRIRQWQTMFRLDLHLPSLWHATWLPFRSASENCFLWQLVYRIPATQHWRFPELPATDPRTWCTRCDRQRMEDIIHCIWSCPVSREVWKWVNYVLCISAPLSDRSPLLQPAQIFIAVEFHDHFSIPKQLWATLRATTTWCIWKARCKHFMEGNRCLSTSIIYKIWARLGVYMRQTWNGYLRNIRMGETTRIAALTSMSGAYGTCSEVWEVHEDKLQIPPVPPRPP